MKTAKILSVVALLSCLGAQAADQPPYQRNYYTTNAAPTLPGGATNAINNSAGIGTNTTLMGSTLITNLYGQWNATGFTNASGSPVASQAYADSKTNVLYGTALVAGSVGSNALADSSIDTNKLTAAAYAALVGGGGAGGGIETNNGVGWNTELRGTPKITEFITVSNEVSGNQVDFMLGAGGFAINQDTSPSFKVRGGGSLQAGDIESLGTVYGSGAGLSNVLEAVSRNAGWITNGTAYGGGVLGPAFTLTNDGSSVVRLTLGSINGETSIDWDGNYISLGHDSYVAGSLYSSASVIASNVTANLFSGGGSALSDLNATALANGTVPVARLGTNGTRAEGWFLQGDNTWVQLSDSFPLLVAANQFTGNQTIIGDVYASGGIYATNGGFFYSTNGSTVMSNAYANNVTVTNSLTASNATFTGSLTATQGPTEFGQVTIQLPITNTVMLATPGGSGPTNIWLIPDGNQTNAGTIKSTATPGFVGTVVGNVTGNATTATTATYVTGNSAALTNGVFATNIVDRAIYNAGTYNGVVIDSTRAYQTFNTNATYSITGFSGLVTGARHIFSMTVTNAAASGIYVTNAANVRYFGSGSTNVVYIAAGKQAILSFWILPSVVTNSCNIVEQ